MRGGSDDRAGRSGHLDLVRADRDAHEAYVEAVLRAVELVPAGSATTYGDVAAFVGRGGPRQVGTVLAQYGDAVCWWRVVRADGRPAVGLESAALARLAADGAPLVGERVDLRSARAHLGG